MQEVPLACTVRQCGQPLTRRERAFDCPNGHTFDVARRGYVNLLQPQDRRSLSAGDSAAALDARARLTAAGIGRAAMDAFVERAAQAATAAVPVVVDLGCGTGDLLGALAAKHAIAGVGVDLSQAAIERAARGVPQLTWVVANADRRLPFLDSSVDVVLSFNARRNPPECARVLAPGGSLLIAVPGADDLIELRERVAGQSVERERADAVVAAHARAFIVADRFTVRERRRLDVEALRDLLAGTYRGARFSAAPRLEALDGLDVTMSSNVLVLRRA